MKVLFVTHYTQMAGANRSLLQLILELRKNHLIDPVVLLPHVKGLQKSLKDYLGMNQIRFIEYGIFIYKNCGKDVAIRLNYKKSLDKIPLLCDTLLNEKFDIVHSNSSVLDLGGYISRILGIKHVWHLREFGKLDYDLDSIWGRKYELETYKNGDAFVAISKVINNHFSKFIPSAKINLIYNGIEVKKDVVLATHNNDIVQFLCAGIVCPSKNQLEIVKAINILVNKRNIKRFHLTIIGLGYGDYIDVLKQYIADCNIEEYITIMGEIDGIESIAATMDVGIMPSHCEAFGRVTVEYMLQNLAVIANDCGANKEIVQDNKTGLIYHIGVYEELADKMQSLIDNRLLLNKLANNGRKKALECFTSSKNSESIFKLYEEVLQLPSGMPVPLKKQKAYKIIQLHYPLDLLENKLLILKHRIQKNVN